MEKRYRVAVLISGADIRSENYDTVSECEEFILRCMEAGEVKQYRILDKSTRTIIQTEKGDNK